MEDKWAGNRSGWDIREAVRHNPDLIRQVGNRPVWLYEVNSETKALLMYFVTNDIQVKGFLVDKSQSELEGISYLNIGIFPIKQVLNKMENDTIVGVSFEKCKELSEKISVPIYTAYESDVKHESVIVYGAGMHGTYAKTMFGFRIVKYCDSSPSKWGTLYCGKKVTSPQTLESDYHGEPIIVAMKKEFANGALSKISEFNFSKGPLYRLSDFNNFFYWSTNWKGIYVEEKERMVGFNPVDLHSIIRNVIKKGKKFILYGQTNSVCRLARSISYLGIEVYRGISIDRFIGRRENLSFIDLWDLVYEDLADSVVWIPFSMENDIRNFIKESGISSSIFWWGQGVPSDIETETCLDPSLGYNIRYKSENSVLTLKTRCNQGIPIKIGILGGSAADITVGPEKSWPEKLIEIADEQNLNIVLLIGAVSGYISSQELVKLVRDIVPLRPNIVISYSGVNEWGNVNNNFFLHRYQEDIFRRLANARTNRFLDDAVPFEKEVILGSKENNRAEHWIMQEEMMYAICQHFNIKFWAISQPYLYSKHPISSCDRETLLCVSPYSIQVSVITEIYRKVQDLSSEKSWLVNFEHVFDKYSEPIYLDKAHLNEYGNQIIAQEIFTIIKKEVIKNQENYEDFMEDYR